MRHLLFLIALLVSTNISEAQVAVVSSYFNAADPRDEWTEILVIEDNADLRNWKLRDNSADQDNWSIEIGFNNTPFWEHMRAGTILMIWHRQYPSTSSTVSHPLDIIKGDGYLELHANDATYFTGGDFGTNPSFSGPTLNIAGSGDIVQLRNSSGVHVHALAHKSTPGNAFNILPLPKLNHTQGLNSNELVFVCPGSTILEYGTSAPQIGTTYTAKASNIAMSFGLPNSCTAGLTTNSDYWRTLRESGWSAPNLIATANGGYTQVTLNWNTCVDPFVSDGTQGYIILRNTTNVFNPPADGTSYIAGSSTGAGIVVANISSSSTTSYTDNIPLPCGENLYYRVYAYRFSDDNTYGNNYNSARGRAYNEINYAASFVAGPSAPIAPISASVDRNNFCSDDAGNIVLTAVGGSGTNLEWFEGSCSGTPVGTGNNLSIPSPGVTTTYYVRWASAGCSPSSCISVIVAVSTAPTTAIAGSDQSKCGVLSTNLAGNIPVTGSGIWTQTSGPMPAIIVNPSLNNTSINAPVQGTYVFRWTISSSPNCTESFDEVTIEFSNAVTVVAGSNSPVCAGENIFLTSSISGATYLWTHPTNGFTSTLQNPVITNSTSANNGTYTVTVTNIPGGCPGSSNSTTIAVNPLPITPPISSQNISGNIQDVCVGSQLPYAIEPATPGSVYNWNLTGGGFIIFMATSDIININWTTPGTYTLSAIETTSLGCSGNPVTLTINVNTVSTAGVSISANNNPLCTGSTVTITASPVNQGTSPNYTWYKNGIQAGAPNTPTYTFLPVDNDQVFVELSSSSPCALPNPVTSNTITITVNSTLVPAISISASNNPVCTGSNVDFTSTISNGGSNPVYQWMKNGMVVGSNSPNYSDYTLLNGDVISCTLLSDESCANPTSAASNLITMSVNPIVNPAIIVSPDINPSCTGDVVIFTAAITNGGNVPIYLWEKNGIPVGGNSSVFTDNLLINNDIIKCTLTSNASCTSSTTASSDPLTVTVNPVPAISGYSLSNPTQCGGTDGSITLSGLTPSTLYNISYNFNGTPITTAESSNGSGIIVITGLSAGNYSGISFILDGCSSLPFDVNLNDPGATLPPTIQSNINTICPGDFVLLNAFGCNGDITWSNGSAGTSISVSPTETTSYTATCTLNGCTSLPSNMLEINVTSIPVITNASVTTPTNWCINDGTITLHGLIINTLYTITYTLNLVNISGSQTSNAAGNVTITGCEPTTYFNISVGLDDCNSESIDVLVGNPDSPQPPLILISKDTICSGETITLTALGCNGIVTWSDGSTGNTLTVTPMTNSSFYATCTEDLCTSAPGDSAFIVVGPAEICSLSGKSNVCLNNEIQLTAIGNATSYDWVLPNRGLFSGPVYEKSPVVPADSGLYQLITKNSTGCYDIDSIRIEVNTPAEVEISSDKDFCAGTQQNLQAGDGFISYLWNDGSKYSSLSVIDEGSYWVTVTDANGCIISDTAALLKCNYDILIPNAFSPDKDGKNEVFRPVTGSMVLLDYEMTIFNRWGQLIYKSNDYLSGWDGTMNKNDAPSGLYSYMISYSIADPKNPSAMSIQKLRGTVTLIR